MMVSLNPPAHKQHVPVQKDTWSPSFYSHTTGERRSHHRDERSAPVQVRSWGHLYHSSLISLSLSSFSSLSLSPSLSLLSPLLSTSLLPPPLHLSLLGEVPSTTHFRALDLASIPSPYHTKVPSFKTHTFPILAHAPVPHMGASPLVYLPHLWNCMRLHTRISWSASCYMIYSLICVRTCMVAGSCWRGNLGCEDRVITTTMETGFVFENQKSSLFGCKPAPTTQLQQQGSRTCVCVCLWKRASTVRPQCLFYAERGAAYFGN